MIARYKMATNLKRVIFCISLLIVIICIFAIKNYSNSALNETFEQSNVSYFSYYWPDSTNDKFYTFEVYDNTGQSVDSLNFELKSDIASSSYFPSQKKYFMYAFGGLVEYDVNLNTLKTITSSEVVIDVFINKENSLYYLSQACDKNLGNVSSCVYLYDYESQTSKLLKSFDKLIMDLIVIGDTLYLNGTDLMSDSYMLYAYSLKDMSLLESREVPVSSLIVVDDHLILTSYDGIADLSANKIISYNKSYSHYIQLVKIIEETYYSVMYDNSSCLVFEDSELIKTFDNCKGYQDVDEYNIMIQINNAFYLYNLNSLETIELPFKNDKSDALHTIYIK